MYMSTPCLMFGIQWWRRSVFVLCPKQTKIAKVLNSFLFFSYLESSEKRTIAVNCHFVHHLTVRNPCIVCVIVDPPPYFFLSFLGPRQKGTREMIMGLWGCYRPSVRRWAIQWTQEHRTFWFLNAINFSTFILIPVRNNNKTKMHLGQVPNHSARNNSGWTTEKKIPR